MAVERE